MSNNNWSVNNNVGGGASKEDEPTQQHMYTTMPTSHEVGGGGASKQNGKYVVFVSSDGVEYKVSLPIASLSGLVQNFQEIERVEDGSMSGSENGNESSNIRLELKNISSKHFPQIVEFMNFYHENPYSKFKRPFDDPKDIKKFMKDLHFPYYQNFAKNFFLIFDLLNIANYMQINPLIELLSAHLGANLKYLEEDDVRSTLGIDESVPRLNDEIDVEVEEEEEVEVEEEVEGILQKVKKTKTVKKMVRMTVEEKIILDNPWIEDYPSD